MKENFRVNNFDLIRLIAALQVVIHHALSHLDVEVSSSLIIELFNFFPGVPIFFFVSGFLISKSYENNSDIKEYAQNRILRIYPALIVCTFITVTSVYLTGYLSSKGISLGEVIIWIVGQISIVQFYNPDFMRGFGTGALNGSLWTITVELQFYIMIPVLYWIFGLAKPSNNKLLLLIAFFMLFHSVRYTLIDDYSNSLLFKLWGVSFIPWIYMFLVGVFFQKNFFILHRLLSKKILYILPLYLVISYFSVEYFGWKMGNGINPILYVFLAIVVFSFAYSFPSFSKSLLKGNDISYGVYIYHIPIINILIYYGYMSNIYYVFLTIAATIIMAIFSWIVIEKRSIKFKKHPLNPLSLANKKSQKYK